MQIGNNILGNAHLQDNVRLENAKTAEQTGRAEPSADISGLREGAVFKGEILDIVGDRVKIALNDKAQLMARLQADVELGVGDQLLFSVKENTANQILIKPMFDSLYSAQTQVLEKALDMAGLLPTEKNFSAAKELMDAGMPVDKGTIVKLLSQSMKFEGASMQTLAALNKMDIPVTEANIAQYERYQGYHHQLSGDIGQTADSMASFTEAFPQNTSGTTLLSVANQLVELFIKEPQGEMNVQIHQETGEVVSNKGYLTDRAANAGGATLAEGAESGTEVLKQADTGIRQANAEAEQVNFGIKQANAETEQVNSGIKQTDVETEQVNFGIKQTETERVNTGIGQTDTGIRQADTEVEQANSGVKQVNKEQEQANSGTRQADTEVKQVDSGIKQADTAIEQVNSGIRQADTGVKRADSPIGQMNSGINEANAKIEGDRPEISRENIKAEKQEIKTMNNAHTANQLGLSRKEIADLSGSLHRAGISGEQIKQIVRESNTSQDLLKNMMKTLNQSGGNDAAIRSLLDSHEFKKLFSDVIKKNWSLNPKDMKEPKEIDELYNKILRQGRAFEEAVASKGGDAKNFSQNFQNMRQNIQFMEQLNHQMIYAQMPLKLSNQNANSELYVYADKRKLMEKKDGISVMLHLDMDHLGKTDIKVTLTGTNVNARFYLNDQESVDIIADNMEQLAKQLADRGFSLTNEVVKRSPQESVNKVVDEVIDENAERSIKRYTFDART